MTMAGVVSVVVVEPVWTEQSPSAPPSDSSSPASVVVVEPVRAEQSSSPAASDSPSPAS